MYKQEIIWCQGPPFCEKCDDIPILTPVDNGCILQPEAATVVFTIISTCKITYILLKTSKTIHQVLSRCENADHYNVIIPIITVCTCVIK